MGVGMGSSAKHTPGPWTVKDGQRARGYMTAVFHDGSAIADVPCQKGDPYDDPEASANARLIAAAPDLLAALRSLLPIAERGRASVLSESSDEERPGHADGFDATIEDARAAIAKASGGAS